MADCSPPTPTAVLISTAILSLITGYMLGVGSSLGLFPNPFSQSSEARAAAKRTKTSNYDDEEESSEEEVDGVLLDHAPNWANGEAADVRDGLKVVKETKPEWENSTEECKLVLVVRTDLGMTKGTLDPPFSYHTAQQLRAFPRRQNRSAMLSRDASLLQELPAQRPEFANPAALGAARTGKSRAASEVRRGSRDVTGAGDKFGDCGGGYCRCGEDTDCEWESYCVRNWTGAEGSSG
jgi:hypothetical protein